MPGLVPWNLAFVMKLPAAAVTSAGPLVAFDGTFAVILVPEIVSVAPFRAAVTAARRLVRGACRS